MLPPARPAASRFRPLFLACAALASLVLPLHADDEEEPPPQSVGEVREVGLMPELTAPLPTRDWDADASAITVDLRNHFTIPGVNPSQLVQFKTSHGAINAELLVGDAPLTVANFKSYLATDNTSAADKLKTYDGTFIHRVTNLNPFVSLPIEIIQGGGFRIDPSLSELTRNSAVVNEFKIANTRGTIAMAKMGGHPNSATSEWFINIEDNRADLGTDNNGGFTVFARILGKGMDTADAIADLPTYNLKDIYPFLSAALTDVPLHDVHPQQKDVYLSNLVAVDSVRQLPLQPPPAGGPSILTYTITNDNPAATVATLVNGVLALKPGKYRGRSIVTVRALEAGGGFAESTVVTTRVGPPILLKALPGTTSAKLGTIAHLRAEITAWPLTIKWQRRASTSAPWQDVTDEGPFSGSATQDLLIDLSAETTEKAAASLALAGTQYRFIVTNTINSVTRTLEGKPTTLRVLPTLAFQDKLAKTTTAALGTAAITLTARATADTLPAPSYQWERKAPGSKIWEPLVDARAATEATEATEDEPAQPAQPAVLSPYSGVTTHTLTIRLNGSTPASGTGISTAATLALDRSQYRCVIRHDRGAGSLAAASTVTTLRITTLRVGFAAQPPALVTRQLGSSATISVTSLPVASNTPVAYQWQRLPAGAHPRTGWVNIANSTEASPTRYTGVTTRTLTIGLAGDDDAAKLAALALNDDLYRCVITVPAVGTATSTAARLRVYAQAFTLVTQQTLTLPGLGAASGRDYAAKGLPKGITLDPETGALSGTPTAKPGLYKITVTIRQGGAVVGTQDYYLEVRALSGNNAGGFEALLSPGADGPPEAKFALLINNTGAFTGTLTTAFEKSPLPFRGVVVRSTSGVLTLAAPITIKRPGAPAGRTYLLSGLTISSTGVLSVTLSAHDSTGDEPVELAGTTTGVRLSGYSAGNPAPWAYMGVYNLALVEASPLEEIEEGDTPPALPLGSGHARAPIDATGRLLIKGKLPDGAPFTAALSTAGDRSYRLFARPYGARPGALISSEFKLAATTVTYSQNNTARTFTRYAVAANGGSDTYWSRPEGVKSPAGYLGGFGPVGLDLRLQPWVIFDGTTIGLTFTGPKENPVVTIGLALDGPVLDNDSPNALALPTLLRFDTRKLSFANASPPDASKLALKLNGNTGALTGTLVLPDGRKVKLEGMVIVPAVADYRFAYPAGTVTAEGFATIPAPSGSSAGPTTERFRLHQQGARPAP